MDQGTLHGIGTLLAMGAFISICVWAWSAKRKKRFDEAANLPFADEDTTHTNNRRSDRSADDSTDQDADDVDSR